MKHSMCRSLCAVVQVVVWAVLVGMGCTAQPPEHGTAFLIELQPAEAITTPISQDVLSRTQEVFRKRLDRFGIKAYVEPVGTNRIRVKLPILTAEQLAGARLALQRNGLIEFRLVHQETEDMIRQGVIPPGYEVLKETRLAPNGQKEAIPYLVGKKPVPGLSGRNVKSTYVFRGQMKRPDIGFKLDSDGTKAFAELTTANIGRQLAIVVDGNLYSAPVIRSPITEGNGVISGNFDEKEAFDLAVLLQNPLEVPAQLIDERSF